MTKGSKVTTVSGHPASLCNPSESGCWRLCEYESQARETDILATAKGHTQMQAGLILEVQPNQQQ